MHLRAQWSELTAPTTPVAEFDPAMTDVRAEPAGRRADQLGDVLVGCGVARLPGTGDTSAGEEGDEITAGDDADGDTPRIDHRNGIDAGRVHETGRVHDSRVDAHHGRNAIKH